MSGPETMLIMSIASTVATTGMSMMQANAESKALEADAKARAVQAEEARRMARLESAQQEVIRQEELSRELKAQSAAAAAMGRTAGRSGSLGAIKKESQRLADRDIENIKLMGLFKDRQFGLQIHDAERNAKQARFNGKLAMCKSLLGGISSIAGKSSKFPNTTSSPNAELDIGL